MSSLSCMGTAVAFRSTTAKTLIATHESQITALTLRTKHFISSSESSRSLALLDDFLTMGITNSEECKNNLGPK